MNERDRRTLRRLLKQRDGKWDKLRRDLVAMPQPKRGRPSKLIDEYTGIRGRGQQCGGDPMNERDCRTLRRLLKQRDGEWDKLRRDLVAMPQPKRGRPSKLIDEYLVVTLKRHCEITRRQEGLEPHAAIRSLVSEMYDIAGERSLAIDLARA
jgi:hypothetical protein